MRDLELKNVITIGGKEYLISTIATPVRHTWFDGDGKRIVYETMVFEIVDSEVMHDRPLFNERYHTAEEAIAEHGAIIQSPEAFFMR
jgi:hypothetical protein